MQKRLFIQYKQVFTILHLNIPSVRTLTLLQLLPRYCRVGKVIVPLIFETTGRNEFYFKQCWCIEATQISPNSKRSFQHTFSTFQQAYSYNLILTVNRNVVCSLRNCASPFWAVKLTALYSSGIVFGNWLAVNLTVGMCVLLIGSTSCGATLPNNVWHQRQRVRF